MPHYSYFAHPQRVCMSYVAHMCFSLRLALDLFVAAVAAVVHAVVPSVCETSTSACVARLGRRLHEAGCR